VTDRILLSALADRLIFGDEQTFRREDATELARLLPPTARAGFFRRFLPDLIVKGTLPGKSASGFAAGVGNVSLNDSKRSLDYDSRGRAVMRAGQWKLLRSGRGIEIEQVMADDADEGRTALIEYRDGEPHQMCLLTIVALQIGPLCIATGRFKPWKKPQ
jgi:hypothetical protein